MNKEKFNSNQKFTTGKLIVIEGTDGSGKTTQTEALLRRLKQEGVEAESLRFPQYEKNLLDIVKRLKSTGAKLIWANTTPILASGPLYDAGSEVEYNAIAARIMTANGIPINDMNTFATAMLLNTKGDPSPLFSRIPLQPPIVRNILRALNLKAEPKDWPVAPGKHKTTVRRESRNPVQTTMITAAETAQPPNEALAATGNNVWWNEERLNIRIPRALTSDALAYYSDQVGNFSKQAIKSHAEPFSQLDYNATVELHKEFKQGDKTFTDVHVVTLKLSFAQYFSSTPADGMHFQKERVVILDAGGKVLHIAGDGPTNVHILSI